MVIKVKRKKPSNTSISNNNERMCIVMDLYITKLVVGSTDNEIFCGISKTFSGAIKLLKELIPSPINYETLSKAPTGIVCRWIDHPNTYICFEIHKHPTLNDNTMWVVTERNEGRMTERICRLYDSEEKALEFIEHNVDEPAYTFRAKCKITEVEGYRPFSRIINNENPELCKNHYTIYETEVKE